jgi:hypothetical protein
VHPDDESDSESSEGEEENELEDLGGEKIELETGVRLKTRRIDKSAKRIRELLKSAETEDGLDRDSVSKVSDTLLDMGDDDSSPSLASELDLKNLKAALKESSAPPATSTSKFTRNMFGRLYSSTNVELSSSSSTGLANFKSSGISQPEKAPRKKSLSTQQQSKKRIPESESSSDDDSSDDESTRRPVFQAVSGNSNLNPPSRPGTAPSFDLPSEMASFIDVANL